jgi:DNA-binding NtrC family response regulator
MNNQISHVLIADHDSQLLAAVSDYLHLNGFKVVAAQVGNAVLDQLESRDFDVALVALCDESQSALDVLSAVRARSPQMEYILMLGESLETSEMQSVNKMEAFGYFQYPFDVEQVLLSVRRAAEKKNSTKRFNAFLRRWKNNWRKVTPYSPTLPAWCRA